MEVATVAHLQSFGAPAAREGAAPPPRETRPEPAPAAPVEVDDRTIIEQQMETFFVPPVTEPDVTTLTPRPEEGRAADEPARSATPDQGQESPPESEPPQPRGQVLDVLA